MVNARRAARYTPPSYPCIRSRQTERSRYRSLGLDDRENGQPPRCLGMPPDATSTAGSLPQTRRSDHPQPSSSRAPAQTWPKFPEYTYLGKPPPLPPPLPRCHILSGPPETPCLGCDYALWRTIKKSQKGNGTSLAWHPPPATCHVYPNRHRPFERPISRRLGWPHIRSVRLLQEDAGPSPGTCPPEDPVQYQASVSSTEAGRPTIGTCVQRPTATRPHRGYEIVREGFQAQHTLDGHSYQRGPQSEGKVHREQASRPLAVLPIGP